MVACKKRSLEYITDESKRRSTFKKRKVNVFKKASELSILCGVKACVVLYSPDEARPEVWPSQGEANELLTRFNQMSEEKKRMKMTDSEKIMRKSIEKTKQELEKIEMENRELELNILLSECMDGRRSIQDLGFDDVVNLTLIVDEKIKKLEERKDEIGKNQEKIDEIRPAESSVTDPGKNILEWMNEIRSSEALVTDSGDEEEEDGRECLQLFPMNTIEEEERTKNEGKSVIN